jgi:hypothetical protein
MVSVGARKTDTKWAPASPLGGSNRHQNRHRARAGFPVKEISMPMLKRVRVIKKIQEGGVWRFVSLQRNGKRYVWDPRPGTYYVEWWDGGQRLREVAGDSPSQAMAAQRRKQLQLARGAHEEPVAKPEVEAKPKSSTPIAAAKEMFLAHIQAHSPDKPETCPATGQVLDHFERLNAHKATVEAITRADIDDYTIRRQQEQSLRHKRLITPPTINLLTGLRKRELYYLACVRATICQSAEPRWSGGDHEPTVFSECDRRGWPTPLRSRSGISSVANLRTSHRSR